jgi:hypothetical protein
MIQHLATIVVAAIGAVAIGYVIAMAILDLTTIQDVWRAQARTEALQGRRGTDRRKS